MSQSLAKIYVHITFSTKNRQPWIDNDIKGKLFDYLGGICKNLECFPVRIGGYKDHVHILCILSKKMTLMKLIEELKKSSSKWIKEVNRRYSGFYWQDGYGAFSVNPKQIDLVADYIKEQEEHHKKITFEDELKAFLKQYAIEHDERYLWD